MAQAYEKKARNLILVLGDQLNADSAAFDGFDRDEDAVLLMEVKEEATYIPQHKLRLVLFFSAMRHFADDLRDRDYTVHYAMLDDPNNRGSFREELKRWVHKTRPERVVCVRPGDYRVMDSVRHAVKNLECELEIRTDRHFMSTVDDFKTFAEGRKSLLMETFYRNMRRDHDILMKGKDPVKGQWNFDKDNRKVFGKNGPSKIKAPRAFSPDRTTREVIELVKGAFPDSPGRLEHFDYPVTHAQALAALRDFVEHRLENFGAYQDAMVTDHPYLYHSRLSCVLNLHLIDHAYAHHIQRLMVMGLFALLLGVKPYEVHKWHLSMYADAIDWVSLPNVLGMSQYGDGGIIGTKPYSASGSYIDKMGDYCADCPFDPKSPLAEKACPFTTLYWDFLSRNRQRLKNNPRMGLQFKNLDRKSDADRKKIREKAHRLKDNLSRDAYL